MSDSHRFRKLREARPLAKAERDILSALLTLAGPDARSYRCQITNARVSEECEDCPTVFLSVDPELCPQIPNPAVPFEGAVRRRSGEDIRVLLFVRNGYVNELETFRTDGEAVRGWPAASQLTFTS